MTTVIEVQHELRDRTWLCTIILDDELTPDQYGELKRFIENCDSSEGLSEPLLVEKITQKVKEMELSVCKKVKYYLMWVNPNK